MITRILKLLIIKYHLWRIESSTRGILESGDGMSEGVSFEPGIGFYIDQYREDSDRAFEENVERLRRLESLRQSSAMYSVLFGETVAECPTCHSFVCQYDFSSIAILSDGHVRLSMVCSDCEMPRAVDLLPEQYAAVVAHDVSTRMEIHSAMEDLGDPNLNIEVSDDLVDEA